MTNRQGQATRRQYRPSELVGIAARDISTVQVDSGVNEACITAVILQRGMVSICPNSVADMGAPVPGAADAAALFVDSVQTIAKHPAQRGAGRAGLATAPSLSMMARTDLAGSPAADVSPASAAGFRGRSEERGGGDRGCR